MRERLSWDKKADMEKKADPYTMNQDRTNPPVQKYDVGGPSEFGEVPDTKTPWKNEGRNEMGMPSPHEAVKSARKMEDRALKCITIAQRMLPGADDMMIEAQATELMYMPERCIMATLQRQSELAEILAAKEEEDDEEEEKEAAKKDEEKEEEEVEAAKKEEKVEPKEEEVEAAKKEEPKKEEEEVEAAKKCPEKKEEEEVEAAKKVEPKKDEMEIEMDEKKADDTDILDAIFANEEQVKTGAKKLSGIVKQASGDNTLESLWNSPPDVSSAFK